MSEPLKKLKKQSREIKGAAATNTADSTVDTITKKSRDDGNKMMKKRRIKNCKFCGKEHEYGKCPAFNRQFNNCGKFNHFASVCTSKQPQSIKEIKRSEVQSSDDEDCEYLLSTVTVDKNANIKLRDSDNDKERPVQDKTEFFINSVADSPTDTNRWQASLKTNGTSVTYMLDSGAQVNVLPEKMYNSLRKKPRLLPTNAKLTAYDGGNISVKGGCIAHVTKGSNKTSPICIKCKNQSRIANIRICLDPKSAIKREYSQMPTAEEIMSQMSGAKLDASAGYWQMKVDKPSSDLLAFNTPFGRYKFKRLPFGVHCASEVFSKRISEVFDGLEGAAHIQDDLIVWAEDEDQHASRLNSVLDRIKASGLKLNRSECVFGVDEIIYVGHIFSHQCLPADPKKIEAITKCLYHRIQLMFIDFSVWLHT